MKLYNELGFESHKFRPWIKKTVLIFKKTGLPEYLFSITTQVIINTTPH